MPASRGRAAGTGGCDAISKRRRSCGVSWSTRECAGTAWPAGRRGCPSGSAGSVARRHFQLRSRCGVERKVDLKVQIALRPGPDATYFLSIAVCEEGRQGVSGRPRLCFSALGATLLPTQGSARGSHFGKLAACVDCHVEGSDGKFPSLCLRASHRWLYNCSTATYHKVSARFYPPFHEDRGFLNTARQ